MSYSNPRYSPWNPSYFKQYIFSLFGDWTSTNQKATEQTRRPTIFIVLSHFNESLFGILLLIRFAVSTILCIYVHILFLFCIRHFVLIFFVVICPLYCFVDVYIFEPIFSRSFNIENKKKLIWSYSNHNNNLIVIFSLSYTLWIMTNFTRLTLLSTMLLAISTCRVQFVPLTETTQATHHTHNFTFSWMLLALLETGNSPLTQKSAHTHTHIYTDNGHTYTLRTHTNVHIYLYLVVYISRFLRQFAFSATYQYSDNCCVFSLSISDFIFYFFVWCSNTLWFISIALFSSQLWERSCSHFSHSSDDMTCCAARTAKSDLRIWYVLERCVHTYTPVWSHTRTTDVHFIIYMTSCEY